MWLQYQSSRMYSIELPTSESNFRFPSLSPIPPGQIKIFILLPRTGVHSRIGLLNLMNVLLFSYMERAECSTRVAICNPSPKYCIRHSSKINKTPIIASQVLQNMDNHGLSHLLLNNKEIALDIIRASTYMSKRQKTFIKFRNGHNA